MSRTATAARSLVGGLGVWLARYLAWSMLALGGLLAIPVVLVPGGRLFLYTAAGWALVHNLFLLLS